MDQGHPDGLGINSCNPMPVELLWRVITGISLVEELWDNPGNQQEAV